MPKVNTLRTRKAPEGFKDIEPVLQELQQKMNIFTKLKQKITEQQIEIDSYLDQIKKLKDKSHHSG